MRLIVRCFRATATLALGVFALVSHCGTESEVRVFTEAVETPERGLTTNCVVFIAGQRLSLLPPRGWSVQPDGTEKLVRLLPEDLKAGVSIRLFTNAGNATLSIDAETARKRLLDRYPDAKVNHEFNCYAGGQTGVAFDIERRVDAQTQAAARLAMVPFPNGVVEFELTASVGSISDYLHLFGSLLASFQTTQVKTEP